jgi:outer membrane protein
VLSGRVGWAAALALVGASVWSGSAFAESMAAAMASAYTNNPDLNSARAQLRAIDEGVPQAKSGFRPQISATGDFSYTTSTSTVTVNPIFGTPFTTTRTTNLNPRGVSLSVEQPIFLGFRTLNSVRMAETSVKAAREQLKLVEASTLLDAVTAFMGVIKAQVVVNLTAQNIQFLREQVRAAEDRLKVGEGTRTDVAQTEASLSSGMSDYAQAVANLNMAIATYVQVIGHRPERLGAVDGVQKFIPPTLDEALQIALRSHPSIVSALYNIDVASWNVQIAEGALLPSVSLKGSVSHRDDNAFSGSWSNSASITAGLSMPLYQGGEVSSKVRELKETLGQRRIQLDSTRAQVRQQLISAWGSLDAAVAQVKAAADQVAAQQLVLSGTIEERRVGQRTTLDVLNAQQNLLNAQVEQVTAQYNRVVAAYSLVAAIGRLDAQTLGLAVIVYDPTAHYDDVKDKWLGLRTPDGR